MSRPRSANEGPKKIYLANKPQDQYKVIIPPESLPNIQYKNHSKYDIRDEEYDEELNLIKTQWDDLGINLEYRTIFINFIKNINNSERKDIFAQEKNNLKKFRDCLISLKKEINSREYNISILKQLDKNLENCINRGDEKNSIDAILKEAINIIKTLRLSAVNIVTRMVKVNQFSTYYKISGKFETSKMRREYYYDPKYLFKMKEDLFFLKNSTLSTFIEMDNSEIDPFLTNCAPTKNKFSNSKKIKIPISDDVMKSITESRYALLQEVVLSTVDKDESLNINTRNLDYYNGSIHRGSSTDKFKTFEEEKYKFNQNRPYITNKFGSAKKNNNFFKTKNMSRYLHNIKNAKGPKRYNNMFYKQSPGNNKLRSGKRRLFDNNSPNIKYFHDYNAPKKIIIEHEVIQSLTNEEFLKKLGNYKNPDFIISNINNQEEEKIVNEEIEILKSQNKNYELKNKELLKKIKKLEDNAKEEEENQDNLKNKYKEISQRAKEYQAELEKISKNSKKKELELNNKIQKLEKENQEKDKKNEEMKNKEDELNKKIQNLENSLENEKNERIKKEKEAEENGNKLKKEQEEREKERMDREYEDRVREDEKRKKEEEKKAKKEEEQKKQNEENEYKKKLEEEITKLKNKNNENDEIIRKKEEEIKNMISKSENIEEEKKNMKNELDKLKEENKKFLEENKKFLEEIKILKEEILKAQQAQEEERKRREEEERIKREEEE